jgi:iron(III) transport system ATP-binding protein
VSLRLEQVSLAYDSRPVVNDVSLDVRPGEVGCLLGPSGCGKTTLLRIAAGLETIDRGRVIIGGRLVADAGSRLHLPPEARRVGLMFQDYALFPHLTVLENVAFGLHDRSGAALARVHDALDRVGLEGYASSYPHVLSGGQQQRCALLRALAPEPAILLLDEPFSNLDVARRAEVREQTLRLLKESHVATLVVTHDPEEAMVIAERLWIMEDGEIVQAGSPEDIYLRPRSAFVARLFGHVNALAGVVRGGSVACALGAFPAPGMADGASAQVLIRPEGIRVCDNGAGVPATVISARLIGLATRLELAVPSAPQPLEVLFPGIFLPHQNAPVTVTADPQLTFVFANSTDR